MPEHDPETVRDTADSILGRPEYREPEPGLVEEAFDWLGRQLSRLFEGFGSGAPGGFALGWLLLILLALAAVWMLYRVMPRRLRRPTPDQVVVETDVRVRTSREEWLERAAAADREGRFRDAVRARYRAMVAGLLDHDELPDEDGATSGEYVSAFEAPSPRGPSFSRASGRFEDTWYGGAEADHEASREMAALDGVVLDREEPAR